ncbi:MAG: cytidylate kinase-like family protein [Raoultibacter sp.]
MKENLVVSISREYGSGGREIGEKLAAKLEVAYYDKELINRIVQKSGLCDEVVEAHDEKLLNRFLFTPNRFLTGSDLEQPIASKIHLAEVDTIRSAAKEGACVIVGRCADSILSEYPGLVSIFVSAPMPDRISRVMCRNNLNENEAKTRITKIDKSRETYYRYFTDKKWGEAKNYDLCVKGGTLSVDDLVDVIAEYLKRTA